MRVLRVESMIGSAKVSLIEEVSVLGLKLLLVGGDGPRPEVIDLLVRIERDLAAAIAAALRLQDANRLALALGGAALRVDGFNVLVEENHHGGILGVCRGGSLGRINRPVRDRLVFAEHTGEARAGGQQEESGQAGGKTRRAG